MKHVQAKRETTRMRVFGEQELSEVLGQRRQAMLCEIEREPSNQLLNVNESDFVKYLVDTYRIEPITFAFDAIQASCTEKLIAPEKHSPDFDRRPGQGYQREVITFHLPFSGDPELLKCRPSNRMIWTYEVTVATSEIRFEVINWRHDAEALRREKQGVLSNIANQNVHVTDEVAQFNLQLEELARRAVSGRKSQLLAQLNVVTSLGVPLSKSSEGPQTFSVPVVPKKLIVKPSAPASNVSPDPTLDDATYQNIISIIHDVGVSLERLPRTYATRQEEILRDFLLTTLCTHYPNSTGETFNKEGRTDILVRHEGKNIFVAECKFWAGVKMFHKTIDQVLSYLTWRESKAAIVCFVLNNEFGPALEQIMTGTPRHPCFIRLESKKDEDWMQFEFRLPSDPTRNLHLAVLCFHFPPRQVTRKKGSSPDRVSWNQNYLEARRRLAEKKRTSKGRMQNAG